MKNTECMYQSACSKFDDDACYPKCIRFEEMRSLLEQSCLPRIKWKPVSLSPDDCDYDAFCELADIKDNIVDFVNNGKSLYLYSSHTGNGKTTWSVKLLLKYFDTICIGNGFRCRGLFIHTPTFLSELKNFNSNNVESKLELDRIKRLLPTVDIVIWDDVASTYLSNYDHSQLITFIDQRVFANKCNIFTGNLDSVALQKAFGARLTSRIWNASNRIVLKGQDKR